MSIGEQVQDRITEDIKRVGWSAVGVFATEEEPITPFCYSIGFTEKGHPEIILYGMPHRTMHSLIAMAYEAITENGCWFKDGDETDAILANGYKVTFRQVPGDGRPAYAAVRRYGPVPVLQMVWPDANHKYPWDEDYDEQYDQPVLADEPDHPDLQERE